MANEITLPAAGLFVGESVLINGSIRYTIAEIREGVARAVQDGPAPNRQQRRAFNAQARRTRPAAV